jgi:hypothetical protein
MSLASTITGLSPYAYYKMDEASGLIQDSSGNARHASSTSGTIRYKAWMPTALGSGGIALGGSSPVMNLPAAVGTGCLPASGMTVAFCFRIRTFRNLQTVFFSQSNSHSNVLTVDVGAASNGASTLIRVSNRGIGTVFTTAAVVSDRHQWHLCIVRINSGSSALSIRVDGVEYYTSGASFGTFSTPGTPVPRFINGTQDASIAHGAVWDSYLSDGNCTSLESAFTADNVYPAISSTPIFGVHADQMFEGTAGKRANRAYHARKTHFRLWRHSMLHDVANSAGTDTSDHTNGAYDWSRPDDLVAQSLKRGLKVMFTITGSATAINGGANRQVIPGTGTDATFTTWKDKMANFATACATRYKAGNAGNPSGVDIYWEVWNEPNLGASWNNTAAGGADAAQYAAFYQSQYAAIKAVDASAPVLFGGLSSWTATGGGSLAGEAFLRAANTAGVGTVDYVSIHPYENSANAITEQSAFVNHFDDIPHVRDVANELGFTSAQLIMSEFGWQSNTSQADQASKTQAALDRIRDYYASLADMWVFFILDTDVPPETWLHAIYNNVSSTEGTDATAKTVAATFHDTLGAYDPAPNVIAS